MAALVAVVETAVVREAAAVAAEVAAVAAGVAAVADLPMHLCCGNKRIEFV